MPSTVSSLLTSVGLQSSGSVPWGTRVPANEPGVYIVSLTAMPLAVHPVHASAPLSEAALADLVGSCPDLSVGGYPHPAVEQLVDRLGSYWLGDETILYVGLAGRSLRTRVGQYYKTPLGAVKPHKGGWWLKALSVLEDLHVHYAVTSNSKAAEEEMLRAFAAGVSSAALERWPAGEPVMPFANLRDGNWRRRDHGIRGATAGAAFETPRGPRSQRGDPVVRRPAAARDAPIDPTESVGTSTLRSQNVTAKDIDVGQVRIPRAAKGAFPAERCEVVVRVRGTELSCRWDPRNGPPERSGVIRIGKSAAADLLRAGDVLVVATSAGTVVQLD